MSGLRFITSSFRWEIKKFIISESWVKILCQCSPRCSTTILFWDLCETPRRRQRQSNRHQSCDCHFRDRMWWGISIDPPARVHRSPWLLTPSGVAEAPIRKVGKLWDLMRGLNGQSSTRLLAVGNWMDLTKQTLLLSKAPITDFNTSGTSKMRMIHFEQKGNGELTWKLSNSSGHLRRISKHRSLSEGLNFQKQNGESYSFCGTKWPTQHHNEIFRPGRVYAKISNISTSLTVNGNGVTTSFRTRA
jgi:hypothetical protein